MAGDWIKMRVGLTTHPRVMRIAECLLESGLYLEWSGLSFGMQGYPPPSASDSRTERHAALRVTRYVTVTALLKFWGYANEHVKGEFIAGVFPEDVDEITGVPGFSEAIHVAGWVEFNPEGGLTMPNFGEHNTSAGERSSGAERQKRYRERSQKTAQDSSSGSDVTRDVTVTRREEKNREEKKETRGTPSGVVSDLLPGIPPQLIADFVTHRKSKKAAITQTAVDGIQREADKAGISLEQALQTCIDRNWVGFKADWLKSSTQPLGAAEWKASQPGGGRKPL